MAQGRAGHYVRQQSGYRAFIPAPFPPDDVAIDGDLLLALGAADRALARLDGAATVLPDVDQFVGMHLFQEATKSSQIEGTQASLVDALEAEVDVEPAERRDAAQEIRNYVAAMNEGLRRLAELPVSLRLIREIHRVMMSDVRGGQPQKSPGEFRRTQNWIGGSSPANARFVPPPVDEMTHALGEWERSVHDRPPYPTLVHAGLLHAQFETIHPFVDGNGRAGRLLITFMLTEWGILSKPLLYLSAFFRHHQDEYYERLQAVRDNGDWEGWLMFFLDGVREVATTATSAVQSILALRERDRRRLAGMGRKAGNALQLHDYLFRQPVVSIKVVERVLDVTPPTAYSLVADLEELGVLVELTGRQRNRAWIYRDYSDVFLSENEPTT